jgi:hypothetical protein
VTPTRARTPSGMEPILAKASMSAEPLSTAPRARPSWAPPREEQPGQAAPTGRKRWCPPAPWPPTPPLRWPSPAAVHPPSESASPSHVGTGLATRERQPS